MYPPTANAPPPLSVHTIAPRDLGSMQTLSAMRRLVSRALTDPAVLNTAKDIVRFLPARAYAMQVDTIRSFLADRFLFMRDPAGVELLHTPRYMLDTIRDRFFFAADCDDAAVLTAALGKAVGLKARFVAVGFESSTGPFAHVFTEIQTPDGRWHEMDITRPSGKTAPPYARIKRLEV